MLKTISQVLARNKTLKKLNLTCNKIGQVSGNIHIYVFVHIINDAMLRYLPIQILFTCAATTNYAEIRYHHVATAILMTNTEYKLNILITNLIL